MVVVVLVLVVAIVIVVVSVVADVGGLMVIVAVWNNCSSVTF